MLNWLLREYYWCIIDCRNNYNEWCECYCNDCKNEFAIYCCECCCFRKPHIETERIIIPTKFKM